MTMNIETIDHVNIETPDIERAERFYADVLGMTTGDRPNFALPGRWMYVNGQPVVHIMTVAQDNALLTGSKDAAISHFALRIENYEDARAHLKSCDIDFEEVVVPGTAMRQLFFSDPDGVLVELIHIPPGAR